MSDVVDEVEESPEVQPLSPEDRRKMVEDLVHHLRQAERIALQLDRGDWAHRIELVRGRVEGTGSRRSSNMSTSPAPLRPVGPMVNLFAWVQQCIQTLRMFEEEVRLAHQEDPANFPLERTSADWYSEFGLRLERSEPVAVAEEEAE